MNAHLSTSADGVVTTMLSILLHERAHTLPSRMPMESRIGMTLCVVLDTGA